MYQCCVYQVIYRHLHLNGETFWKAPPDCFALLPNLLSESRCLYQVQRSQQGRGSSSTEKINIQDNVEIANQVSNTFQVNVNN